jgi:hypothetical protein
MRFRQIRRSRRSGFSRLRLLLGAMLLLAGMHEAYVAANSDSSEHQHLSTRLTNFVTELATRPPLTLILAVIVYVLVTLLGALFSRLNGVSLGAQVPDMRSSDLALITSVQRLRGALRGTRFFCETGK